MTRSNLIDWVEAHGCYVEQLPEGRARAVKFCNPKTKGHAYINTPIDEREEKDYAIYRICVLLGIPIPDCATYLKPLNDHIEREHLGKR
jgi:hypothetical protein